MKKSFSLTLTLHAERNEPVPVEKCSDLEHARLIVIEESGLAISRKALRRSLHDRALKDDPERFQKIEPHADRESALNGWGRRLLREYESVINLCCASLGREVPHLCSALRFPGLLQ